MTRTLYDRLGGFPRVRRVVVAFYDRVLESPLLDHHFRNVDMRRLVDHQTKFIASLMGGPGAYDRETLRRAHAHFHITQPQFAEMLRLLRETLTDSGLAGADVAAVIYEMSQLESAIVAEMATC